MISGTPSTEPPAMAEATHAVSKRHAKPQSWGIILFGDTT
jgi:hypothetical protein